MKLRTLTAATLVFASIGLTAEVQKRDVDLKASDGASIKASYYSPGRLGPGILLLHQCNMDRHAWDGLANDLAAAGFHVVTIDYRGYGDSPGNRSADAGKRPGDADAAFAYLLERAGVDSSRMAAGGASCGVTLSSDLAARHHEIKALVLLSGSASDVARNYISSSNIPVFGAASEGDTNAANGIKAALGASKNPASTLKIYAGTEHGVPMFAKNPELEPMIVNWLKTQLGGDRKASD